MRRGFDTLVQAARDTMGVDPQQGGLFVFAGKRTTRLKVVWIDRHRCCLLWIRLHQAVFTLPDARGNRSVRIDSAQLTQLLEGVPRPR
jgi:transposase